MKREDFLIELFAWLISILLGVMIGVTIAAMI